MELSLETLKLRDGLPMAIESIILGVLGGQRWWSAHKEDAVDRTRHSRNRQPLSPAASQSHAVVCAKVP
jgi:hypothetical protein